MKPNLACRTSQIYVHREHIAVLLGTVHSCVHGGCILAVVVNVDHGLEDRGNVPAADAAMMIDQYSNTVWAIGSPLSS